MSPSMSPSHLNTDNNALVLDDLGEELPTVRFLVERLVEQNNSSDAVRDRGVSGEKKLAEAAAVFLRVFHVDFLETFPHGSLTDMTRKLLSSTQ